jgi:hypothetical protein
MKRAKSNTSNTPIKQSTHKSSAQQRGNSTFDQHIIRYGIYRHAEAMLDTWIRETEEVVKDWEVSIRV